MAKQKYYTQTDLSEYIGINSVNMGKLLIKLGLRKPNSNLPTQEAFDNGYAKLLKVKNAPFDIYKAKWTKEALLFVMDKENISVEKAQSNIMFYKFKELINLYTKNKKYIEKCKAQNLANPNNTYPIDLSEFLNAKSYKEQYEDFQNYYHSVKSKRIVVEEFCKKLDQAYGSEIFLNQSDGMHFKAITEKMNLENEFNGHEIKKNKIL